ncbi:putative toxin-antitoxin system toxin component, PIN family [Anaerolineae bacterium CFX7]|nr:putative toxin-antitoxin system toxin component, PIN family [Anaerolineae bacterium CFX7]RIK24433.1 MAG: putative toxin-antitoxin system toxin component, PIN family [Chloroflexota bacterium]
MIRAFLDANVLVSGAIRPGGKPDQVIRRAGREFEWITSEYVVAEVVDVLARRRIQRKYQAQVSAEFRAGYSARIRELAEFVEPTRTISATSRDINDDPVLAQAADGHADYLVTGDLDLLTLGEFEGIQIVTPEQFLKILDAARED